MATKRKGPSTTLEEQTKSTEVKPPGPRETVAFWAREMTHAANRLKDWHKKADEITKRYLDDRAADTYGSEFRLNLFHSNVLTLESLLYANLPKVQVARRHLDANDDAARVAATMLERLLNNDIQENGRERDAVMRAVVQDRLLGGLGVARVRYTFETEQVQISEALMDPLTGAELLPAQFEEQIKDEQAPIDYYYWQDVLWGWTRNWADMPWLAYRSWLSKTEVAERFPGKEDKIQYSAQPVGDEKESNEVDSPHHKAPVWEIWDRASKCVYWYNEGCPEMLDHKDDPLHLPGFLPSPPFFIANVTTTLYIPRPDYCISQDLYLYIDSLQSRIDILTDAVKVVGVYNAEADGIQRMLKEGVENDLIPVDKWAMFAEQGGLKGQIDWLPSEAVSNSITQLTALRNDAINMLQQTTGMSDVMRGQVNPYEGVGQTDTKTAFGSIRIQALQDQLAQNFSNLLQLQAEVMCRHFEADTILQRSNAQFIAEDPQNVQGALQLLQSPERARLRVEVQAESVALVDQHRVQAERTEFLNSVATFLQSMAPMMEAKPETTPYMLQMLQFGLSGLRGAAEIEGVLDRAIAEAQQAAQNPQPDPEQQAAQMQMQLVQMQSQAKVQEIQAKSMADAQERQMDSQADLQLVQAQHQARMEELAATHAYKMKEIEAGAESKMVLERINMQANIASATQNAAVESEKDDIAAVRDVAVEKAKAENEESDDA